MSQLANGPSVTGRRSQRTPLATQCRRCLGRGAPV